MRPADAPPPVKVRRNALGLTPLAYAIMTSLETGAFSNQVERASLEAMVAERQAAAHEA